MDDAEVDVVGMEEETESVWLVPDDVEADVLETPAELPEPEIELVEALEGIVVVVVADTVVEPVDGDSEDPFVEPVVALTEDPTEGPVEDPLELSNVVLIEPEADETLEEVPVEVEVELETEGGISVFEALLDVS